MRQPVVRFTGSEAAILINMLRPSRAISSCSCYMPGFVAQPATSLAVERSFSRRTNDASDVGFQPARSTAGNVCCLSTKIEAAQHPAIARKVRDALHLQRLQHHTNGTQSPQHLQHTISTASSLARQQHKPSPRNIQNGRPVPPDDRRLHEQAVLGTRSS